MPTSSIPSLSPSYTTKREQHFQGITLLIPSVLRKVNMESNTLQNTMYFFSTKVAVFGKCGDTHDDNAINKK